jgi:hypothetical protein
MSTNYNSQIHELAECYMKCTYGTSYNPIFTDVSLGQSARIADAFETAAQYTSHALVAYDEFIIELLQQWEYVVKSGLHVEPWTETSGEPYKNSQALFDDVLTNNHMWFFLTSNGFGSASESRHPMLQKSGVFLGGIELVYNDIFRIVHDYFGHCIYGFQFGLKGETNAWQSHLAMFHSKNAKRALTNETQGQTSWFQAGKHLRRANGSLPVRTDADFIPLNKRPFAEQRVQLLSTKLFKGLAQF